LRERTRDARGIATSVCRPRYCLRCECTRNGCTNDVVKCCQLGADESHRSDAYHRNESPYQPVLDDRRARLVPKKMCAKLIWHRARSYPGLQGRNQDRSHHMQFLPIPHLCTKGTAKQVPCRTLNFSTTFNDRCEKYLRVNEARRTALRHACGDTAPRSSRKNARGSPVGGTALNNRSSFGIGSDFHSSQLLW
jgi:hypothetical protein